MHWIEYRDKLLNHRHIHFICVFRLSFFFSFIQFTDSILYRKIILINDNDPDSNNVLISAIDIANDWWFQNTVKFIDYALRKRIRKKWFFFFMSQIGVQAANTLDGFVVLCFSFLSTPKNIGCLIGKWMNRIVCILGVPNLRWA